MKFIKEHYSAIIIDLVASVVVSLLIFQISMYIMTGNNIHNETTSIIRQSIMASVFMFLASFIAGIWVIKQDYGE